MRNEELNRKIRAAFSHAAPDVLDSVRSDIESGNPQKQKILVMGGQKNMKAIARRIAGIAAAAVLVLGAASGFAVYNNSYRVASTISLDVNPSVEIRANRKEDVLSVTALNDDGKIILGDMDFEGSSIDVTVNALIGSMLRNGYLTELANSILISVDDDDAEHGAALCQKLADEVNALLQTNTFTGAVLSQTVTADSELQKLASDYGITTGKAQLVNTIVESNPLYIFEELVALSINELNLLNRTEADAVESVGQASDKAYIGSERALEIALDHAGLSEAEVYGLEVEIDYEHGVMVYEVEFDVIGYEYDYDINAVTGEIVKYHRKAGGNAEKEAKSVEKAE
ncbi:MAG: PepSY domain-containing protein, partial [Eubacteriales bacterium]